MKATIKDVAKLAGVSFKTVSRVINREPSVGEDLQRRVWAAIEELNYQPNLSARQLRGAPGFIAFIYDNPNSHYVIEMQHGLLAECRAQGYELLIHPLNSRSDGVQEELEQMLSHGHIAGLVLTPPFSETPELVAALRRRKLSFVRIVSGTADPAENEPCIFVNDYQAAFAITDYLAGLGHRRIAFLGGEDIHRSNMERRRGYLAALADRGIERDDTLIVPGEFNFDSGAERTRQLLTGDPRPTAIFAANDEIAAGALFSARISEVAVPQELSIVGFEDSPFSRQTWPKLTTAHQPNTAIAGSAASHLIASIRAARQGTDTATDALPDNGFLPTLVVRDSTCPPAQ
ncbi:LacI family DNA-binding transcriptional regulator [Parahaliea mediterranea]|uniref:LacI family DNA-binding transcriptional regulator n=1 Tax=Parahaliea mediterranea TaxID=651086 RepID=A0A939IH85_9GAMM|nr:LacI family DNA-binding transcriptional regulator [Parahaliea mediterranea]MBN7795059.1 LacI family DNA-binding transcriptional regulator [Parahaliea mediterranea]